MAGESYKPHAILVPYPLQGHVIPFAHLALKLASDHGFTITFVNTQSVHNQISKAQLFGQEEDMFTEARKSSGLDIRYKTVSDGFPLEFDRSLNHDEFFEGILHSFSDYVDELVGDLVGCDHPAANILIADTFYVWNSFIAKKHNLVNISFWTEPALVLTLYYHMDLLRERGHFPSRGNQCDFEVDYIPGVKAIKPNDLMSYLQETNDSSMVHQILNKAFADVKKADFIIANTVEELEFDTIAALHQKQPIFSIGPIFPIGSDFTNQPVAMSLWSESDCTKWLNAKPDGSVLYVSFGSYAHTSKQDILEIAQGLLLSEVNFIWVLRPDIVSSEETDILPDGYQDSIKGRGLIVQWCSQPDVISHPATGGFLTHCGWNSILESVWCGVPFICYPLLTDQFTNRKLVVDDWGVGINLRDGKSINREEVAEKIKYLMGEKTSGDIRMRIKKVKTTLENALDTDGSSVRNLDHLATDVKAKILKMRNGFA